MLGFVNLAIAIDLRARLRDSRDTHRTPAEISPQLFLSQTISTGAGIPGT
jgi:hypothetical protein